jgi:hypothetical protein
MKTGVLLASAVVVCALATGCANVNLARHGCDSCGSKVGCGQMACTGVASAGGAGVASTGPAGVAATPPAVAGTGPYDPGMNGGYNGYGGYGGGRGGFGGFGRGGMPMDGAYGGGAPSAQVAYPYYTTRGPRDFLTNNPPSIGY